jgi:hypothetical protein
VVKEVCGADAVVDVQQATKVYNDYCSANGFAVPGYTYISTQTVQVSTGVQNPPATGTTVMTAGGDVGGGSVPERTVTATVTAGVAPAATAPSRSTGSHRDQATLLLQTLFSVILLFVVES